MPTPSRRARADHHLTTSAGNQFAGEITALLGGPVNAEVQLRLAGGQALVAVVTQHSAQRLGLVVGAQVLAIVPASGVLVVVGHGGPATSAHNRLAGTVQALACGPVNAEVAIRLRGAGVLRAVITRDAVAALGLAPGVAATALVPASQVLLAVPG